MYKFSSRLTVAMVAVVLTVVSAFVHVSIGAGETHRTPQFQGPKANTGFVTHAREGGKSLLTLSDDFVTPDTPDPHWQLVDSRGQVYLVQRLMVKPDRLNKTIEVPSYVKDVKTVQIWCAYAETLLGETSFSSPVN